MSTLLELKTKIANDLHRGDMNVQIGEAVDAAIKHYGRERWWFLETNTTISASISTTYYSLPTDIIQIDSVNIIYSGSKTPLDKITFEELDSEDAGNVTGIPDSYTLYQDQIRFYPVPNGAYPVVISYHKSLDAPSDAASNSWTTDAEQLIRFRAEWDLFANYLYNPERAQAAKMSESEAFSNLLSNNVKRVSVGKIKKSGW